MSTSAFDFRRTPSLQHAAYLIGQTVDSTAERIRLLRRSRPPYRLEVARRLVVAVLQGREFDWARRQAETISDKALRGATTEILVCLEDYLSNVPVKWYRPIDTFPYPIGRGLAIPINPLGIVSDGETIRLLWPQIWRSRTLNPEQFNILGAVLERAVFATEPDITELEWLEMSVPRGSKVRELRIRGRDTYASMSEEDLALALDRLAAAVEIVNSEPRSYPKPPRDPDTPDMFGKRP